MTFLHAIAAGDAPTARRASVGTPADQEWIDAVIALSEGLRAYDKAITARFPAEAGSLHAEIEQTVTLLVDQPITYTEGGILQEADETAQINPAFKGMRLGAHPSLPLRKEKGLWKVDLEAMRQDPQHDPDTIKQFLATGKALRQAAREIAAGKYQTFDEAQRGLVPDLR